MAVGEWGDAARWYPDVVALAFHEPRLRALHPWTSHYILHFSANDEFPYARGLPFVEPAATPGRYIVHPRRGHAHPETDAATALRQVLDGLPAQS